jgi:hypothetical protein
MILSLPKFWASVAACLYLAAGGAWAQSQEQTQERLVDTVNQTEQASARAGEKLRAGDTAAGCAELRAALTGSDTSLDMIRQLLGQIRQDTTLHGSIRNQMLQDLQSMSVRLESQKQGLDAQISGRCP